MIMYRTIKKTLCKPHFHDPIGLVIYSGSDINWAMRRSEEYNNYYRESEGNCGCMYEVEEFE